MAALVAVLIVGAGTLSARTPLVSTPLEQAVGSVQYPSFAMDRGLEGVVNVIFSLDEKGSVSGLTVWGNEPRLAAYVERQLNRKTRRLEDVPAELADGVYRLVFQMSDGKAPIVPFDQIIRNEMLSFEGSNLFGTANVMVKTNEAGIIEDIRVWGGNNHLVSQLEARLNKLSGQTVDSAEGETTLRYRLVMK